MQNVYRRGQIGKQEIADFFEAHGISHSKQVVFGIDTYTVTSYRRDENGLYVVSQDHPGEPIIDEETFLYGH